MSLCLDYPPKDSRAAKKIAQQLAHFVSQTEEDGLDILDFPPRKIKRPTYAYSFHWETETTASGKSRDVGNQHLLVAEDLYRWLEKDRDFKPANEMWKETRKHRTWKDKHGFPHTEEYTTTDLRLKKGKSRRTPRKLYAYNDVQQNAMVEALLEIGNTEMTLAFLTALLAGPRMQSVFTTQRSTFPKEVKTDYLEVPIGEGTNIDSKNNVYNNIYYPKFLVEMIDIYLSSDRYERRSKKSQRGLDDDNYVYLTRNGTPYYAKKDDKFRGEYTSDPQGKAVYAFISQQLVPKLKKNGHDFNVRFHNLRATFANNLAKSLLESHERGEITIRQVLITVCQRLGHANLTVTELYLEDLKRDEITALTQTKFEAYLEERIRRSFGGLNGTDPDPSADLSPH